MAKPEHHAPHGRPALRTGFPGEICGHLDSVNDVRPRSSGCEECLKMGDTWVHLRICRSCGHVGCCDSSKNKHATRHFQATGHPIITSLEPGETWSWCYIDELMLEPND